MSIWDKAGGAGAPTKEGSLAGWPAKENPGSGSTPTAPAGGRGAKSASKPSFGGTTGVSRDEYWANKEARDLEKDRIYREEDIPAIRRSTAYSVAAELAAAALAHDVLSFGSAAKAKRLDMFLDYVDHIAAHVYAKVQGEEITVAAQAAEEEANDGADSEQPELG